MTHSVHPEIQNHEKERQKEGRQVWWSGDRRRANQENHHIKYYSKNDFNYKS